MNLVKKSHDMLLIVDALAANGSTSLSRELTSSRRSKTVREAEGHRR